MAGSWLGRLRLGLHLHRQPARSLPKIDLPPGDGPVLIVSADDAAPACQVIAALRHLRPDLRLIRTGQDGVPDLDNDPLAAPQLLAQTAPFAVLLLGSSLPAALIHAASQADIPVILADARVVGAHGGISQPGSLRRHLLHLLTRLLLADQASSDAARKAGLPADRISMTGPLTEIHDPLRYAEAERAAIASLLQGRQTWLAAAIPESEEQAVILAHRAALRYSHRALLIAVPANPARAEAFAHALETAGFNVARRRRDEDPSDEVQVLIAEDEEELGLWYRLAPVSFMGGTLGGDDKAARHPFEPAALGSAAIHGPATRAFALQWQQLDGAAAARAVSNPAELADAVADLAQPDQTAQLAANAWLVSTGGAGVAMNVAQEVLAFAPPRPATHAGQD